MTSERIMNLTSPAMWGGALMSGAGSLTFTDWLAIGGFILAALGFIVNLWFKITMVKLEKQKINNMRDK